MSTTIEQSLKQIIAAAIHQVKSKEYERPDDVDPVEAFIEDLFAVLFPTAQTVQTVTVPTIAAAPEPVAAPEKPKRGRKPKAAAPAPAPEAAPAPEPAKPKRGRKPKTTPPTTPPAAAPEVAEAPPAPKKEQTKNIEKLTATSKKHIKKWAEEVGAAEPDTKALLAHMNAMSAEDFNAQTFEAHVKAFLKPAEEEETELNVIEKEFNGKTYYIDEETNRVYEEQDGKHVGVGYVGMAAFADLTL